MSFDLIFNDCVTKAHNLCKREQTGQSSEICLSHMVDMAEQKFKGYIVSVLKMYFQPFKFQDFKWWGICLIYRWKPLWCFTYHIIHLIHYALYNYLWETKKFIWSGWNKYSISNKNKTLELNIYCCYNEHLLYIHALITVLGKKIYE